MSAHLHRCVLDHIYVTVYEYIFERVPMEVQMKA